MRKTDTFSKVIFGTDAAAANADEPVESAVSLETRIILTPPLVRCYRERHRLRDCVMLIKQRFNYVAWFRHMGPC